MEEIERSAGSVEEAIEAALADLGLSEQEAHIEIVQEPRSGFLGMNSQPAVVKARPKQPAPATAAADQDLIDEQAEVAADFVEGIMRAAGLDAEIEIADVDGATYVDVFGAESAEDMAIMIGKRGHTLESLQELVRGHVLRETGERCVVLVDVEDYRKRRRRKIIQQARDAARKVKQMGRPETLEPMSAYERKLVHDAVAQVGGLETASEGEEPNRRVVIRRRG